LTNVALAPPGEQRDADCSIGHYPGLQWEFDETVTRMFDDMLARSIPQIASMRDVVRSIGGALIQPRTDVLDLGCASGEGIAGFIAGREKSNRFIGIDRSQPMLAEARRRFQALIDDGTVEFQDVDLRAQYPEVKASLTLCVLTLQFVPVEYRHRVLSHAKAHSLPGGGLILIEKILGYDHATNTLLVDQYYAHKRTMGYSQEEIDSKRRALEGVLVPLTAAWNEDLLRSAGFRHVECIWRCLNFCGWVALA
jgi:tRNA (cmo5U34)-methyltransferase